MSKSIGILEICEPNHYSAVNGLMKTYAYDSANNVYVFTIPKIKKALEESGLLPNIKIISWDDKQTSKIDFFNHINSFHLDRIHICTISGDYKSFADFHFDAKEIYTHIHNIDIWFNDTLDRALGIMLFDLKNKTANRKRYRIVGRFFLEFFFNRAYRKKYLNKLRNKSHQFIVHSEGQKGLLSKYIPQEKITVFPFAIYEGLLDGSATNSKLRICIPGVITSERREYKLLFETLLERIQNVKGKLLIDLLGYIPESEKSEMESLIEKVQEAGIDVIYYQGFVFGKQFDDSLSQSDVLLNNQKVEKNTTGKYGVTKESGMIFNMIKGAKVGIIPSDYQVSDEFKASTLSFDSYQELGDLIEKLANNPEVIKSLKDKAIILSEAYSPVNLYERLKTW
jgi:hypothetical protein